MPRINVWEKDSTLTQFSQEIYNAVYIPGFVTATGSEVAQPYSLQLLRSVSDLKTYVGSSAARFMGPQYYREMGTIQPQSSTTTTGYFWPKEAVPTEYEVMFTAGTSDPSYVLAEKLLTAGVPVYYDRVNVLDFEEDAEATEADFEIQLTETWPALPASGPQTSGWKVVIPDPGEGVQGSTDTPYVIAYWVMGDAEIGETSGWSVRGSANVAFIEDASATTKGKLAIKPGTYTVNNIGVKTAYNYMGGYTWAGETVDSRYKVTKGNDILDKSVNKIKYMTTGGYPVLEAGQFTGSILEKLVSLTAIVSSADASGSDSRDDVILLVDHVNNLDRELTGTGSVYDSLLNTSSPNPWNPDKIPQAAIFTPGVVMNGVNYPGSYGYLLTMAESVKTNPNWLAVAGVKRGVATSISGLATNKKMTRAIADYLNTIPENGGVAMNAYTPVRGTGLTIWGNRTLAGAMSTAEKAEYFLNMRSLICEIKKRTYTACEQLMFEQNGDVLWINFKSKITPLLDQMVTSNGISGYKIIKEEIQDALTGEAVKKSKLKALIKVFPIYAVEEFEICVNLTNEETEVTEG